MSPLKRAEVAVQVALLRLGFHGQDAGKRWKTRPSLFGKAYVQGPCLKN